MGKPVPAVVTTARARVGKEFKRAGYSVRDASSETTGKDYLLKIWTMALSAPVGIAIIHEGIAPETMANIYYELGWMQAYGRKPLSSGLVT